MSKLSSDDAIEKVGSHLEETLAFSGLLSLPGFVGTVLVGRGILNIYGAEFQQGYLVLVLLAAASIWYSYHAQFVNTISAIDRPDISFKINVFFVMSNTVLNVLLVYSYGWIGAAVATALSSFLSSLLSYWLVRRLVPFSLPLREVSRQLLAAALMGGTVFAFVRLLTQYGIDTEQIVPVLVLVGVGVIVYFTVLILISSRLRTAVSDNTPIQLPQWGI